MVGGGSVGAGFKLARQSTARRHRFTPPVPIVAALFPQGTMPANQCLSVPALGVPEVVCVTHARPDDVTGSYAADRTVEQLRKPA